ncbi:DUF1350 family protein [Prochlorococcus sp. MIT 1223]|uniref:DUF1350 family protein n=1 Tax=Prochlorococcus sp. MIT 1223 TaxID=3096217 RepID=UPI002A75B631|nr:DUF1350 family protein [Prochlorococcus sp. MIT 1223]
MCKWRLLNKIWCIWPSRPLGLIEFIGGSYLSASPNISYKYFLESLKKKGFAIHAWTYLPSFDHQSQANDAWRNFRLCRKKIESRVNAPLKVIRIGHSLGCKLHLLSPDRGRNNCALISLSFNNFNANKSIPMLGKISNKLNLKTEFSPSPIETLDLIRSQYIQQNNLIINFLNDRIDQSPILTNALKSRAKDSTTELKLKGDHLTPVSSGLRKNLFSEWSDETYKIKNLNELINTIQRYSIKALGS